MCAQVTPIIGIIGGIGSGKSAVAQALGSHLRVCILDADRVGHDALNEPAVREQLVEIFGSGILDQKQHVVRSEIAKQVFGDQPEKQSLRQQLNRIVHPVIRGKLTDQIDKARQQAAYDVIVLDAALLLESDWHEMCRAIVFVDTPMADRVQRVAGRGWSAAELERREASQLPLTEKQQRADFVVDNSGSLEDSARVLADWLRQNILSHQESFSSGLTSS